MNPATHKECPDCGKLVPLDRLAAHALKCWTPLQGVTNADSPQSTRADHPLAGRPVVATPTHEPELTALRAELEATRDQAADLTTQRDTARRDADHNLRDLLELRRKVEAEEDAREHQRRAILKAKPLDPLELGQPDQLRDPLHPRRPNGHRRRPHHPLRDSDRNLPTPPHQPSRAETHGTNPTTP